MARQALTVPTFAPQNGAPNPTFPAASASSAPSSQPISGSPDAPSTSSGGLPAAALPRAAEDWLLDCEYRLLAPSTISTRRVFLSKLKWFLDHRRYAECGTRELREFFHYLYHGHEEGGRWGHKHLDKAVRPETVRDYWICFSTFFKWLVSEETIAVSPMQKIPKPVVRSEEKHPLIAAEIKALLAAARSSQHAKRDRAVLYLLLDTGIRSSELTGLKIKDVNLGMRQCRVLGKGNKFRVVHFGITTGNALRIYLKTRDDDRDEPLFLADKAGGRRRPLTRSGLQQLLKRLAKAAGITGRSCSPHVLRRTFAVTWLRNGANIFSLQAMLGHSDLRMTQRYLALAQADIAEQARQFSPADKLANLRGV